MTSLLETEPQFKLLRVLGKKGVDLSQVRFICVAENLPEGKRYHYVETTHDCTRYIPYVSFEFFDMTSLELLIENGEMCPACFEAGSFTFTSSQEVSSKKAAFPFELDRECLRAVVSFLSLPDAETGFKGLHRWLGKYAESKLRLTKHAGFLDEVPGFEDLRALLKVREESFQSSFKKERDGEIGKLLLKQLAHSYLAGDSVFEELMCNSNPLERELREFRRSQNEILADKIASSEILAVGRFGYRDEHLKKYSELPAEIFTITLWFTEGEFHQLPLAAFLALSKVNQPAPFKGVELTEKPLTSEQLETFATLFTDSCRDSEASTPSAAEIFKTASLL